MLVMQCAPIHIFFRNDQDVRLLKHVRLLERLWYLKLQNKLDDPNQTFSVYFIGLISPNILYNDGTQQNYI